MLDIASKGYIQEYRSGQAQEQGAGSDLLLYKVHTMYLES